MQTTKSNKAGERTQIENGDTVWISGYEFTVTEVDNGETRNAYGNRVWYFTGILTENPVNDSILWTCYNGGRLSWRKNDNLTKAL